MNDIATQILAFLGRYMSAPTSRALIASAARRARLQLETLTPPDIPTLLKELEPGLRIFIQEPASLENCKSFIANMAGENGGARVGAAVELQAAVESRRVVKTKGGLGLARSKLAKKPSSGGGNDGGAPAAAEVVYLSDPFGDD